jgi:hypothetical protein
VLAEHITKENAVALDTQVILTQIDALLNQNSQLAARAKFDDLSDLPDQELAAIQTSMAVALKRLAPKDSDYVTVADAMIKNHGIANNRINATLAGSLTALRNDYAAGYLKSITEIIHAEVFSDFLEMAEHLLNSGGYKDAAAVMVGGVLEEHLRKLCDKFSIPTTQNGKPKKLDSMNSDIAGAGVYSKLEQKSVTAWADLRNSAAHGEYTNYSKEQVVLMLQGVRDFIVRNPA